MNDEKSNDDGVKQEIKVTRDDRYSSWNDGRSKQMDEGLVVQVTFWSKTLRLDFV